MYVHTHILLTIVTIMYIYVYANVGTYFEYKNCLNKRGRCFASSFYRYDQVWCTGR